MDDGPPEFMKFSAPPEAWFPDAPKPEEWYLAGMSAGPGTSPVHASRRTPALAERRWSTSAASRRSFRSGGFGEPRGTAERPTINPSVLSDSPYEVIGQSSATAGSAADRGVRMTYLHADHLAFSL